MNLSEFVIHDNGDIRAGEIFQRYSVLEFYHGLISWFNLPHNADLVTPIRKHNDEIIELCSPYNIDDDLAHWLDGGCIKQGNGVYYVSGIDYNLITIDGETK